MGALDPALQYELGRDLFEMLPRPDRQFGAGGEAKLTDSTGLVQSVGHRNEGVGPCGAAVIQFSMYRCPVERGDGWLLTRRIVLFQQEAQDADPVVIYEANGC